MSLILFTIVVSACAIRVLNTDSKGANGSTLEGGQAGGGGHMQLKGIITRLN